MKKEYNLENGKYQKRKEKSFLKMEKKQIIIGFLTSLCYI